MPSLPKPDARVLPEVDDALTRLLHAHLGSAGITLDAAQLLQIKQQEPVLRFLDELPTLARRLLAQQQRAGETRLEEPSATAADDVAPPADKPDAEPAAPVDSGAEPLATPPLAPPPPPIIEKWTGPDLTAELAAQQAAASVRETGAMPPLKSPTPTPDEEPTAVQASSREEAAGDFPAGDAPEPALEPVPEPQVMTDKDKPAATAPLKPEAAPSAQIRLPNATAETAYTHTIDLSASPELRGYTLAAVEALDETGLEFDVATRSLRGAPTTPPGQPHEFALPARLQRVSGVGPQTRDATLLLFVNPHPRHLWKKREPAADLPFPKPHECCAALDGTSLRAVAASVRGRSHANSGSFREDDFHLIHDSSGHWTVVAVSDGAGSAPLSRRGSQLIVETASQELAAALPPIEAKLKQTLAQQHPDLHFSDAAHAQLDRLLLEPVGRAAFNASRAVVNEANKLGAEEKSFAATLLLAAVRRHAGGLLVASYWIGDGAAAVFRPEGEGAPTVTMLGDADSGEFSGQTRFLQSGEFAPEPWAAIRKRVRVDWYPPGSFVVLMTDGVSDPKFGTDSALHDPAHWAQWWREDFTAAVELWRDPASTPQQIQSWLDFWSRGEHDDRTLALVY